MSDNKSADEVYCGSCGEAIKKRAKVCPNCGVANERYERSSGSQTTTRRAANNSVSNPTTERTDPTNSQPTDVSDSWHYATGASIALWTVGFGVPDTLAGLMFIIAWVLMPASIYFDTQWVSAKTHWQPDSNVWIGVSALPLINIPMGAIYLFRRYNADRSSEENYTAPGSDSDSALEELRGRYSRGEISDEEFEQRVEKLVGTEDNASAEKYIESEK